jgi:peptide/nickel transport system substrate-binding protein
LNRRLLPVVVLAVVLVAVIGVVAALYRQPQQVRVVVYAYRDAITGIDPGAEDDVGVVVLHALYDTLLRYDPRTGGYVPWLAERFERVAEDRWVIAIRRGAVFHDGSPVTAEDVKFSIERSKALYEEGVGLGYVWECVREVRVLNATHLEVVTDGPCDLRRAASAAYSAFVYSRRVLQLSGAANVTDRRLIEWFNSGRELGSGPYRLRSYKPEREVVLEKFQDWWGWRVVNNPRAPDVVVIRIVEDPGEQERGLRAGEIHVASSVPRAVLRSLKEGGFEIRVVDTYHNFILMFNVLRWPTNVTEVRKALALAIPWDSLVPTCLHGYGRVGSGLIPYGFPGYDPELRLSQNLEEAARLLAEAGVPSGTELEIVITAGYEEEECFAQLLASELAKLGLRLRITSLPWDLVKQRGAEAWSNPEAAPHMVFNDWWPTYVTPYDYLSLLECGYVTWNWSGYCNEDFDEKLWEAYRVDIADLDQALPLYRELQRYVYEELPAVNLWDMQHIYVYNPKKVLLPERALNPLYTYVVFFEYLEVLG